MARLNKSALTAVQPGYESSLDHDAMANIHGALNRRLHAWSEVDDTAIESRLTWIEGQVKSSAECSRPNVLAAAATNLMLLSTPKILLAVKAHQLALGAIGVLREGKPFQHE